MSFASLPPEIISQILSYFGHKYAVREEYLPMRQLTRIARVSHAFYDIALPHLYRSAKPRYTQKSRDKLLRTLIERPELGILIQRLSLLLSHEGETGPIADEIKSIRSTFDLITRSPLLTGDGPNLLLLYLMPRLQKLKITGQQWELLVSEWFGEDTRRARKRLRPPPVPICFSNLRKIAIENEAFKPMPQQVMDSIGPLLALPKLEEIKLRCFYYGPDTKFPEVEQLLALDPEQRPKFALRRLYFTLSCISPLNRGFVSLMGLIADNLTEFSYEYAHPRRHSYPPDRSRHEYSMVADPLATVPNAVVITTLSPLTESNNLTSLGLLFRSRNAVAIDCVMNTLPQFTNLRKLAISSIMISDAIAPVGEAKRMTAATINGALELVPLTVVEMWIFNYEKKKWYVQEKRTADKFVPALAKDNVERRGGNIKFLCWGETEKFEVGYVRNKVEQSGYGDSFKIVGWGYVYDGCPKPWTPRGYVYSAYYGYPRDPGRAWRYGLQESDSEADCR